MMAVEIIKAVEICRGAGLDSALLLYFLQSTRFCESNRGRFIDVERIDRTVLEPDEWEIGFEVRY